MAGKATITVNVNVTGIGDNIDVSNTKAITVPVEVVHGFTVVATAQTTAIALGSITEHIALAKTIGIYIKAEVGTIYINVDTAGTGTFAAAAADLVLNQSEACFLPINPAGNLGVQIDASAVTDAFSWIVLAKA